MYFRSTGFMAACFNSSILVPDTPSNRNRLLRLLQNGEVKGKKFGKRWFVYASEIKGEDNEQSW